MTEDVAATIRQWMRDVIATQSVGGKPLSARRWALMAGLNPAAVQKAIKEDYGFTTSTRTLVALARAVGVDLPPSLRIAVAIDATATAAVTDEAFAVIGLSAGLTLSLPITHSLEVGRWSELNLSDSPLARARVPALAQFPQSIPQWLARVSGGAYSQFIPNGYIVHVIDAGPISYAPRQGDTVVLLRKRDEGRLEERTLRQVDVSDGRLGLWTRPGAPSDAEAVWLSQVRDEAANVQAVIEGLVVRAERTFA